MSAAGIALSRSASIVLPQPVHTPYSPESIRAMRPVHLRQEVAHVLLQRHVQFLAERGRALVGHVVAVVVLAAHVGESLVAGLLQIGEVLRRAVRDRRRAASSVRRASSCPWRSSRRVRRRAAERRGASYVDACFHCRPPAEAGQRAPARRCGRDSPLGPAYHRGAAARTGRGAPGSEPTSVRRFQQRGHFVPVGRQHLDRDLLVRPGRRSRVSETMKRSASSRRPARAEASTTSFRRRHDEPRLLALADLLRVALLLERLHRLVADAEQRRRSRASSAAASSA